MVVLWRTYKPALQEGIMKKILLQGITIIVLFLGTWLILKQVDWMTVLKIERTKAGIEEKLGKIFLDIFKSTDNENTDESVKASVDSILAAICNGNDIDEKRIKIHILQNEQVNAFALPDGNLVIFTGLIRASEKQEELCGVICHEIAHIELDHVMKRLIKEVGFNVLLSMSSNGSSDLARKTAKLLSSSAFDRDMEAAADLKAIDYLVNAGVDPDLFSTFLLRISKDDDEITKRLSWISTHPDSEARAAGMVKYASGKDRGKRQILSESTWNELKEKLKE